MSFFLRLTGKSFSTERPHAYVPPPKLGHDRRDLVHDAGRPESFVTGFGPVAEQTLGLESAAQLPGDCTGRIDDDDLRAGDVSNQSAQERIMCAAEHENVGSLL